MRQPLLSTYLEETYENVKVIKKLHVIPASSHIWCMFRELQERKRIDCLFIQVAIETEESGDKFDAGVRVWSAGIRATANLKKNKPRKKRVENQEEGRDMIGVRFI